MRTESCAEGRSAAAYPINEYRRGIFLPDLLQADEQKTPAAHAVQPVFLYAHPVTDKTGGKDQKPMVK